MELFQNGRFGSGSSAAISKKCKICPPIKREFNYKNDTERSVLDVDKPNSFILDTESAFPDPEPKPIQVTFGIPF